MHFTTNNCVGYAARWIAGDPQSLGCYTELYWVVHDREAGTNLHKSRWENDLPPHRERRISRGVSKGLDVGS